MQSILLERTALTAASCGAMFFASMQFLSPQRNVRLKWSVLAACVTIAAIHGLFLERKTLFESIATNGVGAVVASLFMTDLLYALAYVVGLASVCMVLESGASRLLRGPRRAIPALFLELSLWAVALVACALLARSVSVGKVVPLGGESALETGIVMPFVAVGGLAGSALVLLVLRVRRPHGNVSPE